MTVLTVKAGEMLDDLQPELADEPLVQMAYIAIGNELGRLEMAATGLRDGFFPSTAAEPALSLYELVFGLPVAPAGQTIDERRQLVLAHFRKRIAGSGTDWELALTKAMGATDYTYIEQPNRVTIRYAFASGAPTSSAVQDIARQITPAHVQVLAAYSQGFLIGVSLIGDPL